MSRKLEVIFIKAWRGAAVITVRQCRAWLAIPFVFSASRQVLCSPSTVCFSPCLPPNKALFLGHFSLSISGMCASLCYACIFNLRLRLFEIPHSLLAIKCCFAVLRGRGSTAIEREPILCFEAVKVLFCFFVFFPLSPFKQRIVTSLNTDTKTRTTRESLLRCSWEITTLQQCHWNLWEPSRV